MKAIGFREHLDIDDEKSLVDVEVSRPVATGHDLLVKTSAVAVNPVDVSIRKNGHGVLKEPQIIGWDACGTVAEVGAEVTLFKPGTRVYYAGSFARSGSDSEYQLVDERIVGSAPQKLTAAQAAAMPLTGLTAYEALFEQLELAIDPSRNVGKTILIINGAGGVGSIATQLAHLAGLKVIATASRPDSIEWTKNHGADFVVNHRSDLVKQVRAFGHRYVDYILELSDLDGHWNEMCKLIKPEGRIVSTTENLQPINLRALTKKKAHFAWEWIFTKSYYQTSDMISQHEILDKLAAMLDSGLLECTLTKTLTPLNAQNLRKAHKLVESGHMIGKAVVAGWQE